MLPSQYNEDRIVLLSRDPHWLYAYWEISEERKNEFYKDFGQELWEKSSPVLKVINVTKNESFFVRINDFSDNWYINVPDSNSTYVAEIGRMVSGRFFINLVCSNQAVTPGENISLNTSVLFVDYRDLRSGLVDLSAIKSYEPGNFKTQTLEPLINVSSPGLFGGKFEEHLGISSANFMQRG